MVKNIKIYRASLRHIEQAKPLFRKYRLFYNMNDKGVESDQFILKRLTDERAVIFVAEFDSATVGFAQLYYSLSSVNVRSELILNDLYVEPGYRKNGIASKLIERCIDYSAQENINVIKLETAINNVEAKRLYERFGFCKKAGFDCHFLTVAQQKSSPKFVVAQKAAESTKPKIKLAESTVLITGVTQGLGEALVEEFVNAGYIVLGCGRNQDKLQKLRQRYPYCDFAMVDVSHLYGVTEWVDYVLANYGIPKFVINNASILEDAQQLFVDMGLHQARQVIDVNVMGTMYVTHAILKYMQLFPNQTTLVNISSEWGRQAGSTEKVAVYCASKYAVEGFSNVIALQNKNLVTVVTLDPGAGIATPMLAKCVDAEYYSNRPGAQEWAKVAVPYILSITPDESGNQLTVPEVNKNSNISM